MRNGMTLGITLGDVNGIGPEIVLKSLFRHAYDPAVRFCLFGPWEALQFWGERLGIEIGECRRLSIDALSTAMESGQIFHAEYQEAGAGKIEIGTPTPESGTQAALAIEHTVRQALQKNLDAIVTAPISKHALHAASVRYPGHTEYLAHLCGVDDPVMMLVAGEFRVALLTTHCALSEVASQVNRRRVLRTLEVLRAELSQRFGLAEPRIAVAALNPHAGEDGDFGGEEQEILAPAIAAARAQNIDARGPFPADALFSRIWRQEKFDAYLAMYHDQGLIPLKMRAAGRAVNFTCGLPVIRTSPDHGTAFDIAGKGIADETSMVEAIKLAIALAKTREAG